MANVKVSDGKTMWIRVSGELYKAVEALAVERGLYHGTKDGTPKPNVSGMARIALRTGVGALRGGNGNGRHADEAK